MRVLPRSQGKVRLAVATLAIGLAGGAVSGSPPAQAQALSPVITGHEAVSWGYNGNGELGNGTTTNSAKFGPVTRLGVSVVQVAAGSGAQSLAVLSDGTVWAWGSNFYGQLGNGTATDSPVTVPVQVPGLTGIVAVAAGFEHDLALREDGTVWAWGGNPDGQMGNGTTGSPELTPVEVTGLTGVTKIAAGALFSLALRSDGTVWAWGDNSMGQLGNGTMTSSAVPVRVTGLSQVRSIAAGADASYAINTRSITALTSVWAWGGNERGQLGDGTLTTHTTPEQVTGISAPGIAGIAAGKESAVALGTDGSVWGWGDNTGGQLGSAPAANPVLGPTETIGSGSGITQLSANSYFLSNPIYSDVLALKSDGTVLAWGDNSAGQLGDGTTASHIGPEQVRGLTGATQVSAGASSSLAVTALATVPSVRGLTVVAAGGALQAAGFVLGQVSTAPDYTCNHIGVIVGQSPAAGTSAILGSPVGVTVGVRPPTPCP